MMTSASAPHMEHMWRGFPEEILVSNVLPRLPMASLCRFRAVCKKWNALPTQRDFAAQHALAFPVEEELVLVTFAKEFVLITLRLMQHANSLKGFWNVLDVVNDIISVRSWQFLGDDGGLLLLCLGGTRDGPSLIVCNPILKAVKVIPTTLDRWFHYSVHVVMFTDTISMEYTILVIHPMEYYYQTNYMDIFESKTGKWKRVVNNSVDPSPPWRSCQRSKIVKFENAMYQLHCGCKTDEDWKLYLIRFDKKTGLGSILNFPELFPGYKDCTRAHTLELVVSLGRLFCVYRPHEKHDDCVEVFEVFLERQEWKNFVSMPRALLHWLHSDLEEEGPGIVDPIGCASSILFCSSVVGRFVTYDLASKMWDQFSPNCPLPLYEPPSLYFPRTNFGLSLCPP